MNGRVGESDWKDVIFHDASTAVSTGATFFTGGFKTLTIEISGTSTTRTVAFKAIGPSGGSIALMGTNLSTLTTGTSSTGNNELWQFDITGLNTIIMDLTAATGGNVSVKGKVVA